MRYIVVAFILFFYQFCFSQSGNIDSIFKIIRTVNLLNKNLDFDVTSINNYLSPHISYWETSDTYFPLMQYDSNIIFIFEQQFNDTLIFLFDDSVYFYNEINTIRSLAIVPILFVFNNKNYSCPPLIKLFLKNQREAIFFKLLYGYRFVYIQRAPDKKWFIEYSNNRKTYH